MEWRDERRLRFIEAVKFELKVEFSYSKNGWLICQHVMGCQRMAKCFYLTLKWGGEIKGF